MPMLPPELQTPREVTLYYNSVYDHLVESGQARPFVYPWAGIGAFVVLAYLLIDHRRSPFWRWFRYPVFVFLAAFQTWCIFTNKAKHPEAAFGVGLLSSWGVLWVATLMIINDCQADFKRIERYQKDDNGNWIPTVDKPLANGSSAQSKKHADGAIDPNRTAKPSNPGSNNGLYWQQYPSTIRNRLDWVADVFCSFRGVGWNWQISGIPPPPKAIERQLHLSVDNDRSEDVTWSRSGIRRYSSRDGLLRAVVAKMIVGYLALDVIVAIMHNDAYFLGHMDAAPPHYLPIYLQNTYIFVKYYRLIVGLVGMYAALTQAFNLGPFFFSILLGPELIGARGEPWMNPPDMFGSYSNVFDHGLAGWWGGWWHQTFRYSFEAVAGKLRSALNVDQRSEAGKAISMFTAFFLSGCLHAAGSYTQLGETRPLMGPFRFFLLQPLGILLQMFLSRQLARVGIQQRTPKALRKVVNFVYVHAWGYFTAPLLIDDFAKGGVFLFEPIAISPLRALGFGAKDDTWYCWWNGLLFWRTGESWFDTGIAA